jgi:hypothetical protein
MYTHTHMSKMGLNVKNRPDLHAHTDDMIGAEEGNYTHTRARAHTHTHTHTDYMIGAEGLTFTHIVFSYYRMCSLTTEYVRLLHTHTHTDYMIGAEEGNYSYDMSSNIIMVYFISYILIVSYVMTSVLLAILIEKFDESKASCVFVFCTWFRAS